MSFTTQQIAALVGGELTGPAGLRVTAMRSLDEAGPEHLTFIGDRRYADHWPRSKACAALAARGLELPDSDGRAVIRVADVDLAVAVVLAALAPKPVEPPAGIHRAAVVEDSAVLGRDVRVGPHCYIGHGVVIGDEAVLHASVAVLDESAIGPQTVLWPGVVVRERCAIGARCILHPNAVIGADGFGFRPAPGGQGLVKVPQIGNVVIGDDVEIGATTCVDRAKFGSTEIGDMTKIDNQCQIAHNCRVGRRVVIAGGTGLAGSVTVGDGAMFGGYVAVRDHVTIGAGAKIMGSAAVMNDVPAGETWGGYPAKEAKIAAREYASIRRLPELTKLLRKNG